MELGFVFIAHRVHNILLLLDSPNNQQQAKEMDLLNAVKLMHSVTDCVHDLRHDDLPTTTSPNKLEKEDVLPT